MGGETWKDYWERESNRKRIIAKFIGQVAEDTRFVWSKHKKTDRIRGLFLERSDEERAEIADWYATERVTGRLFRSCTKRMVNDLSDAFNDKSDPDDLWPEWPPFAEARALWMHNNSIPSRSGNDDNDEEEPEDYADPSYYEEENCE